MPYVQAGDLNTYYIERGDGIPALFVHGNWSTSSWWEQVLDRLPGGIRGIAYDVRGRGKTAGPDNEYTMGELAADLRNLCDALGLGNVHLVGHSLGSAIAMQFALDNRARMLSVTAISPAWVDGMPAAYNVPAGQQAIKSDRVLFGTAIKAMAPTAAEDEHWRRLVDEGYEQRLEAALKNLPALVDWQPGDALGDLSVPALVISGSLDPLTGGANAERAASALKARHVLLDDIGHSPPVEAPDRVVELLLEHWGASRQG